MCCVVDMRKGFDGLSSLMRNHLQQDPLTGDVFVFVSRARTHIKLLYWDGDGFLLYYKRLAIGRKNYMFTGSHDGAVRIAIYRSFFATCILNNINPHSWLRYVLQNINSTAPINYHTLLPNFIDPNLLAS